MTEKRQEKESTTSPWRVRDYRSWFVADTASALGTTIGGFAFTLVAYAVSHDVTTAGMVGTVFALCEGLGTLPGGHLSDRIDRKKLMIVFGLISAATLCVMTLALVAKMMSAPLLFLFAIVRGLTSGVFPMCPISSCLRSSPGISWCKPIPRMNRAMHASNCSPNRCQGSCTD